MRADFHDGPEHSTLQSEAGYIDARPQADRSTKLSCNARPHHTLRSENLMGRQPWPRQSPRRAAETSRAAARRMQRALSDGSDEQHRLARTGVPIDEGMALRSRRQHVELGLLGRQKARRAVAIRLGIPPLAAQGAFLDRRGEVRSRSRGAINAPEMRYLAEGDGRNCRDCATYSFE